MRCERARPTLLAMADAGERPTMAGEVSATLGVRGERGAREHIRKCLRCQAELAQHRRIRRRLSGLRSVTVEPEATLLDSIIDVLTGPAAAASIAASTDSEEWYAGLLRRRAAWAGAAGAVGVMVLAGTLLWVSQADRRACPAPV